MNLLLRCYEHRIKCIDATLGRVFLYDFCVASPGAKAPLLYHLWILLLFWQHSSAICWRLANKSRVYLTIYAHNSIGWLHNSFFKSNFAVLAGGPGQIDTPKKKIDGFLGKGKEWQLHKNLCYDWVSCKAVSKMHKKWQSFRSRRKKDTFSHRYCNTVSFLLNRISHATHANEQTAVVLLTLEFITSIVGLHLRIASDTVNMAFFFFFFPPPVFVWTATRITLILAWIALSEW